MSSKNILVRSKKKQAQALLRENRLSEAKALYERICQTDPRDAEAWFALGTIYHHFGADNEAAVCYTRVVAILPKHAEACFRLGNILWEQKRFEEAAVSYRNVLEIQPDNAGVCCNLSATLEALKQYETAIEHLQQMLRRQPNRADLHYNLGNALKGLGKLSEAEQSYRTAIALKPDLAQAHCNLGVTLEAKDQTDEAIACYRRAIEVRSDYAEAYYNLGSALGNAGRLEQAATSLRHVLKLQPRHVPAHSNLGLVLAKQGSLDEALASYRHALEIEPNNPVIGSNLLFHLNYDPACDQAALFTAHRRWAEIQTPAREAIEAHFNTPDPGRVLRIGYVSPDFRDHSVAFFMEPILASHDAASVEIFCYANVSRPDATTERLKQYAVRWHDVHGKDDAELIALIRADKIDILIDLAGHTGRNRLPVFARKPAPVQAAYLGYPNTTGLSTVDYRITDEIADPPDQDIFYTEKLIRLPGGFLCYRPPAAAPAVTPPPALDIGNLTTFGSFNMLSKINAGVVKLWAEILRCLPGSRLIIKNNSFCDDATREHYLGLFAQHGITHERIELIPWIKHLADHLSVYDKVDIALDTFPYNGTTTTCEALWMGVPVVTLTGDRHAGRVGTSLLTQIGLSELIAKTPEDYLGIAFALANDLSRLATLRATLRERMHRSLLCDGTGFTRRLEKAYHEMWREWCVQQPSF